MNGSKKWYTSKTLWFGVLSVIAGVLVNYGYTGEIPAEWAVYVPVVQGLVIIILRILTKQAVKL